MDKENPNNNFMFDSENSEASTLSRKSILRNLDPYFNTSPEVSVQDRVINKSISRNDFSPLIKLDNDNQNSNNDTLPDYNLSKNDCFESNPLINLGNSQDKTQKFSVRSMSNNNFTEQEPYENVHIDDISLYLKEQETIPQDVRIDDLLSLDKFTNRVMSIERVDDIRKYHQSKIEYYLKNEFELNLKIKELQENLENLQIINTQEKSELQRQIDQLLLNNSEKDVKIKQNDEIIQQITSKNDTEHNERITNLEEQLQQLRSTNENQKKEYETKTVELNNTINILQKENNQMASSSIQYMTLLEKYWDVNNELEDQLKISKSEYNNLETYLPDIVSKFHKAKDVIARQELNEKEITLLNNKLKMEIKNLQENLIKEVNFAEEKYKDYEGKLSLLCRQATLIMEADQKIEKENQIKMNLFGELRRTLRMD